MSSKDKKVYGRGTPENLPNRFERLHYDLHADEEVSLEEEPLPKTHFLKDSSKTIITLNDSPDVGFSASINPYRGCEHGCVYCYARPTHEYLGFSAGLDFESKILVKENAPELLRKEISSSKWKPQTLAMSGVTDCYQPIERHLKLTRRCLEVLAEFRNPVAIVTKNRLILRDLDILAELARCQAVAVFISVTTLDDDLRLKLEPRTSSPVQRLKVIETLSKAGIPVGVLVAPIIPALNDHEIPLIIKQSVRAGAQFAGYALVRLPYGVGDLFENWLMRHFPDRKEKVMNRVREVRGGKRNETRFKSRMRGEGLFAQQIRDLFNLACRKEKISGGGPELSIKAFRNPMSFQMDFFKEVDSSDPVDESKGGSDGMGGSLEGNIETQKKAPTSFSSVLSNNKG